MSQLKNEHEIDNGKGSALACFSLRASFITVLVIAGLVLFGKFTDNLSDVHLSAIGNGTPAVVLVNFGECVGCGDIEGKARSALTGLPDVQILVADTCTSSGKWFTETYQTRPISVLLFNGEGTNTRTIKGLQTEATYHAVFKQWLDEQCNEHEAAINRTVRFNPEDIEELLPLNQKNTNVHTEISHSV